MSRDAVSGYTAAEVARLLGLPANRVRSWVRDGLLDAARGPRGEYRFSFGDLVLLRVARDLLRARVPRRRVRRALGQLRKSLPEGRSLSELQIRAEGDRVVVHDGDRKWDPESEQLHFNFEVKDLARRAAPIARRHARAARADDSGLNAEDWYELACELEEPSPRDAREGYRRALELDPAHADAHINLGRLLHEDGDLAAAEAHYREALRADPSEATAAFNLGVVLEDQGRSADAVAAYERAILADQGHADAHFNAAAQCERLGRHAAALRHWNRYRALTHG